MDIRSLLIGNNFRYNKALGQNFITDTNLLDAIAEDANITSEDTVVEIGTGAGTLTRSLAKRAKRVITFEVDRNLEPILKTTLSTFDNIKVCFEDVLKMTDEEFLDIVDGEFMVVANLPYYITTPLIMRFFESDLPVKSLTLMMQKEVANRMIAKAGTSDYGAITAVIDLQSNVTIARNISREMFYPVPKVDSALVHIEIDKNKHKIEDLNFVKKVIKSAFMWRRKTFVNNMNSSFSLPKEEGVKMLEEMGFVSTIRGEKFNTTEFIELASKIKVYKDNH
ncbi:MAG: 16S rRNA (adenine(1518)-N(6)/adenine(1519)-N(6))-dimethyltransferase RsmA [Clostridia bacterium]